MEKRKNPKNMGLGEIVRELTQISQIKILELLQENAPPNTFGNPYKDTKDMESREKTLYIELNQRENLYW